MVNPWKSGAREVSVDDSGRVVEVFVTEELTRTGTLVLGFDSVWRVLFDNTQKRELVSIPRWRFE